MTGRSLQNHPAHPLHRAGWLLAPLVAALFACASTPDAAPRTDPVGCWYFERTAAADELNLPWGVRLADEMLTGFPAIQQRGDVRVARTLTPAGEREHPFGYWLAAAADSIEVGYPMGGGLVLRLAHADDRLRGTARAVGDAMTAGAPPRPVRQVTLTFARCP